MTAGQWIEAVIGFVIPTAAVVWGVWMLWRWFRPSDIKQRSGVVAAVMAFVLAALLVFLIVLAWELFKTWKRPQDSTRPGSSVSELQDAVIIDAFDPAA
jgi:hypothetical protein